MIQATGKIAATVTEGLKNAGPIALPLVVINVVCLVIVGYVLYEVSDASKRRDTLITDLAKNCMPIVSKPQ